MTDELLTREQAARFLGVKAQTLALWTMTHRYDLPVVKVGSRVRYRKSDLDKWLESRVIGVGESKRRVKL